MRSDILAMLLTWLVVTAANLFARPATQPATTRPAWPERHIVSGLVQDAGGEEDEGKLEVFDFIGEVGVGGRCGGRGGMLIGEDARGGRGLRGRTSGRGKVVGVGGRRVGGDGEDSAAGAAGGSAGEVGFAAMQSAAGLALKGGVGHAHGSWGGVCARGGGGAIRW